MRNLSVFLLALIFMCQAAAAEWICNEQGIRASVNGGGTRAILEELVKQPPNDERKKLNPVTGPIGPASPFQVSPGSVHVNATGDLVAVLPDGTEISSAKPAYTPRDEYHRVEAEIDPITGEVIEVKFKKLNGGWAAPRTPRSRRIPPVTPTPLPACGSATAPECRGTCAGTQICTNRNNVCQCESNVPPTATPYITTSAPGEDCGENCPSFEVEYYPASGLLQILWSDGSQSIYQQYRVLTPNRYEYRIFSEQDVFGNGKNYIYTQDGYLDRTREGLVETRNVAVGASSWATKVFICADGQCQSAAELPQYQVTYSNDAQGRISAIAGVAKEALIEPGSNDVYSGVTNNIQTSVIYGFDTNNNLTSVSVNRGGELRNITTAQYVYNPTLAKVVVSQTTDERGVVSAFSYEVVNAKIFKTTVTRGDVLREIYTWSANKIVEHKVISLKGLGADEAGSVESPSELMTSYAYSECGCSVLKSVVDAVGNEVHYTYEPGTTSLKSLSYTNPAAPSNLLVTSFNYGSFENGTPLESIVDPYGNQTSIENKFVSGTTKPEEIGTTVTFKDIDGVSQSLTDKVKYTSTGQVFGVKAASGVVTQYTYGERGLIVSTAVGVEGAQPFTVNLTHHDSTIASLDREAVTRNVMGVRVGNDLIASYLYEPLSQRLFSVTRWGSGANPLEHTEFRYDKRGQLGMLSSMNRDPEGQGVADHRSTGTQRGRSNINQYFKRDSQGDLVLVVSDNKLPLSAPSISSTINPSEYSYSRMTYDSQTGVALSSTDELGNVVGYGYNGYGDLTIVSRNGTVISRTGYSQAGIKWSEVLARELNGALSYTRSNYLRAEGLKGAIVAQVDPLGIENRTLVSTNGQEIRRVISQAGVVKTTVIKKLDELGRTISSSVLSPVTNRTITLGAIKYVGLNPTEVRDQYGVLAEIKYDSVARVKEVLGRFLNNEFVYRANSSELARTIRASKGDETPKHITDYAFDNLGRAVFSSSWVQGLAGEASDKVETLLKYGSQGQLAEVVISSPKFSLQRQSGYYADGSQHYTLSEPEGLRVSVERSVDISTSELVTQLVDKANRIHESRVSFNGLVGKSRAAGTQAWSTATFSKAGSLTMRQSPAGVIANYGYDPMGRLLSMSATGGAAVGNIDRSYQYKTDGKLDRITENNPLGVQSAIFGYDELGAVNSITTQLPSSLATAPVIESWDYWSATGTKYNASKPSTVSINGAAVDGVTIGYEYDSLARVKKVSYLQAPNGVAPLIAEYSYKEASTVPSTILGPNGTTRTNIFDNLGRLLESRMTQSGALIDGFKVASRDKYEQTNGTQWLVPRPGRGVGDRFEANSRGYLEKAKFGMTTPDFSSPITGIAARNSTTIQYDTNSVLRSSVNTSGVNPVGDSFTIDSGTGRYNSLNGQAISYNTDGQLSSALGRSFSYDPLGRLAGIQVGTDVTGIAYDILGREVAEVRTAGTSLYRYAGSVRVADGASTAGQFVLNTLYGTGAETLDQLLSLSKRGTSSFSTFAVSPGLTSPSAVFNSTGLVESYAYSANGQREIFDPQGNVLPVSSITNSQSFTGQHEVGANTGVMNFRGRFFDQKTNTFLQPESPTTNLANFLSQYNGFTNPQFQRDPDGWQTIPTRQIPGNGAFGESVNVPLIPPFMLMYNAESSTLKFNPLNGQITNNGVPYVPTVADFMGNNINIDPTTTILQFPPGSSFQDRLTIQLDAIHAATSPLYGVVAGETGSYDLGIAAELLGNMAGVAFVALPQLSTAAAAERTVRSMRHATACGSETRAVIAPVAVARPHFAFSRVQGEGSNFGISDPLIKSWLQRIQSKGVSVRIVPQDDAFLRENKAEALYSTLLNEIVVKDTADRMTVLHEIVHAMQHRYGVDRFNLPFQHLGITENMFGVENALEIHNLVFMQRHRGLLQKVFGFPDTDIPGYNAFIADYLQRLGAPGWNRLPNYR